MTDSHATPLHPGVSLTDLTDSTTPVYWFGKWAGTRACVVRVGGRPPNSIRAGSGAEAELSRVIAAEGRAVDLVASRVLRTGEQCLVELSGLLFDALALAVLRPTTARLVATETTRGFDTPTMVGLDATGEPFFILAPCDSPSARLPREAAQP